MVSSVRVRTTLDVRIPRIELRWVPGARGSDCGVSDAGCLPNSSAAAVLRGLAAGGVGDVPVSELLGRAAPIASACVLPIALDEAALSPLV
jgi:hypothetical protein